MTRVLITGAPRAGKTTLGLRMLDEAPEYKGGLPPRLMHTDDLIGKLRGSPAESWSAASAAVSEWFDQDGPWIVEGVTVPRALRKWLARNPEGKPCDRVRLLWTPREVLSEGQAAMAKGTRTVWDIVEPELRSRGVEIEVLP